MIISVAIATAQQREDEEFDTIPNKSQQNVSVFVELHVAVCTMDLHGAAGGHVGLHKKYEITLSTMVYMYMYITT